MKKYFFIALILTVCTSIISCKETFLEQQPIGSYSESSLNSSEGIQKTLIGAYSLLNGSNDGMTTAPGQLLFGSIRGGEAHKGSDPGDQPQMFEFQRYDVSSGNSNNQAFFRFYYNAVSRCNMVLSLLNTITSGLTEDERTQIAAEARFLRGHYYFMLKRVYQNIPWIDENSPDARVPNFDESGNYINIWPNIEADFNFARKNLHESKKDLGRANKWAAQAYYAKVRIYMGNEGDATGYADALSTLNDVMTNGKTNKLEKYALYKDFHTNFDADKENGSEWVWGVQHSTNDGLPGVNSGNASHDMVYISPQNGVISGRGYSFFAPTQWFVDHFRVDENGLPFLDYYVTNPKSVKNDEGLTSVDNFIPETSFLDPRLDWTVGRRGIPFHDFGIMPGTDWLRDQASAGPYMSKKFFTLKKDVGKYTSGRTNNALNIALIRYADVILMAAEMEVRIGDLNRARELVNQVRNRMATNTNSSQNWVKSPDGISNAANYKISTYPSGSTAFASSSQALRTILFERLLELGLEGHSAYDIVRFGKADNATDVEYLNAFLAFESKLRGHLVGVVYKKEDGILPIPQRAIDNSAINGQATLKQNPGY